MLGHGGASHSPRRSRARAAIGALLVAASLVAGVSAVAAAGDEGSGDPTTSVPPTTAEPATTATATPPTTAAPESTTTTTPAPTTTTPTTTTAPPPTTTAAAPRPTAAAAAEPTGTTAATPTAACGVRRTLRRFDTGRDVACLERELTRRGYSVEFPNAGRYDTSTAAAVREVQRNRNLLVTGVAGPATLAKLGIWSGVRLNVPCSVAAPVVRGTHTRRARCVEQRLIRLGYIVVGPDRRFDRSAARATRAFQRRQGIAVARGAAGPWTLAKLGIWSGASLAVKCTAWRPVLVGTRGDPARCLEQRLIRLGYPLRSPDRFFEAFSTEFLRRYEGAHGIPVDGRAGKYELTALGIWEEPPPVTCKVGRPVRLGTVGKRAKCVERKLVALGYVLYGPNRRFDEAAADAVRAYQASKGLDVDGIAGPFTLFSLGLWSGHNPYGPPPVPANSGTGRRIVYSRAMQRMWAIEADGTVVKTHLVSGRLYEPYAGTYSVYSRSMYTYSVADPNVKWRYMVRFAYGPDGGRIGFHEIPTRFGVPLQSVSQLGQPLSGGCVRQSTADAIWTWNWAYLGTKVVVL